MNIESKYGSRSKTQATGYWMMTGRCVYSPIVYASVRLDTLGRLMKPL